MLFRQSNLIIVWLVERAGCRRRNTDMAVQAPLVLLYLKLPLQDLKGVTVADRLVCNNGCAG
jgi:hypothetical protein